MEVAKDQTPRRTLTLQPDIRLLKGQEVKSCVPFSDNIFLRRQLSETDDEAMQLSFSLYFFSKSHGCMFGSQNN